MSQVLDVEGSCGLQSSMGRAWDFAPDKALRVQVLGRSRVEHARCVQLRQRKRTIPTARCAKEHEQSKKKTIPTIGAAADFCGKCTVLSLLQAP